MLIEQYLAKMIQLIRLIEVLVFLLLSGNIHTGFESSVLGCFR